LNIRNRFKNNILDRVFIKKTFKTRSNQIHFFKTNFFILTLAISGAYEKIRITPKHNIVRQFSASVESGR
jgi:hypothetical protein